MRLYVARHAYAGLALEDYEADQERHLTPEGRAAALCIAEAMHDRDDRPRVILSAPAVRTVETAEMLSCNLWHGTVPMEVHDELHRYEKPKKMLKWLFDEVLDAGRSRVMLVGHTDNLPDLLRLMNGGDKVDHFKMGEVRRLCIDRDTGQWEETWRLCPSDLGLTDYD